MMLASFNPYEILGVAQTASDQEIRKRYKKLVFDLHPDRNPDDESGSSFKTVVQAYEILRDPDSRYRWDLEYHGVIPEHVSGEKRQRRSRSPVTTEEFRQRDEFAEQLSAQILGSGFDRHAGGDAKWLQNVTILVVVLIYGAMTVHDPGVIEQSNSLFWGATLFGILMIWLPDLGEDFCYGMFANPVFKILGWVILIGFALFVWHVSAAWSYSVGTLQR